MSDEMTAPLSGTSRWLTYSLWGAKIVLAVGFGMAGYLKTFSPIPDLAATLNWTGELPEWLVRFIGIAELAGAIGIVLPAATRIQPWLTPLAAVGFAVIQILAIGFHAMRGETAMSLPINLVLLLLALFVFWGRWHKAPVAGRG
jgi:uncharacterized membrane protein YphA (DoxX/SURF4 family)